MAAHVPLHRSPPRVRCAPTAQLTARYRNVYYHKQTHNQWARDDPAMLILISLALLSKLAWE